LDDLDEFVGFVAVAAGVVEEFFGPFSYCALFGHQAGPAFRNDA